MEHHPFIRGLVHFPVAEADGMTQNLMEKLQIFLLDPKLFSFFN